MRQKNIIHFIIFFAVVIVFFKPYYFTHHDMIIINLIYLNSLRLVFITVFIIYLIRGRISKFIFALFVFYFFKAISILINDGSFSTLITAMYPALAICMFIEIGMSINPRKLIDSFLFGLSALIFINFITMIISPYGYGFVEKQIFFLRHANQLAPMYILTITFIALKNDQNPNFMSTIHLWLALTICTYMVIHVGSNSNLISWLIIVLYYVFRFILKKSKIVNFKTYVVAYAVLFYGVIIYGVQERFADVWVRWLGADITMSGRTYLWNIALDLIKERPVIGYGMAGHNIIAVPGGLYLSAHNQFIQLLIEGGFISLVSFAYVVYLTAKKIDIYKNSQSAKILAIGILSIALVLFSESIGFFSILILLSLSYNFNNRNFVSGTVE